MDRSTLERLAPLAGILAVVLFVLSFIVLGETPGTDDPAEEVVSFWQENETEAGWAGGLLMWGSVFAVWFGAALRTALRRAEGEPARLSAIAFAGWVIFAVGATAFAGFNFALSDVADEAAVTGDTIQTLSILSTDFFPIVATGTAIAYLGTAVAVIRFGGLPRWLGWVALVVGIAAVTPIGWIAFMVNGIWVLIASVVLYARGGVSTQPPKPAAPIG